MNSKSVSGTGPLVFNDDVTAECKGLHSQIQPNTTKLIGLGVTMKGDKDSKLSAKETLGQATEEKPEDAQTKKGGTTLPERKHRCPWILDFRCSVTAMDFHSSTKNNTNV